MGGLASVDGEAEHLRGLLTPLIASHHNLHHHPEDRLAVAIDRPRSRDH